MPRLTPIEPVSKEPKPYSPTSVLLTPEMREQIDEEKVRVGAKSRSDLIKLIISAYFEEEI